MELSVDEALRRADTNDDGFITYAEYVEAVHHEEHTYDSHDNQNAHLSTETPSHNSYQFAPPDNADIPPIAE